MLYLQQPAILFMCKPEDLPQLKADLVSLQKGA
jgi:hypothetical protein